MHRLIAYLDALALILQEVKVLENPEVILRRVMAARAAAEVAVRT